MSQLESYSDVRKKIEKSINSNKKAEEEIYVADVPELSKAHADDRPVIGGWRWTRELKPGGDGFISLRVWNRTGRYYHSSIISLFFGPAHFVPEAASAINFRDSRWAYVSELKVLEINPELTTFEFNFKVPQDIEIGYHFANFILWRYEEEWDRNFARLDIRK